MADENTEMENDKQRVNANAINFLQSQIAKYYGNDGILSSKEKTELDELAKSLGVEDEQYERLVKIAQDEIRNFKMFDVISFLLDREDKLKLYSDAERLSIRISRVERWIAELDGIVTPKEDDPNKREIQIDKMKKIMKWFDQELFVETNEDVSNDEMAAKTSENGSAEENNQESVKGNADRIADEINDFINEENNLAWRSYCKYRLMKKIKNPDADLPQELDNCYKTIEGDIDCGEVKGLDGKPVTRADFQYKDLDKVVGNKKNGKKNDFEKNITGFVTREKNGEQFDEDVKKELDAIKMRLRQYSDMKKLFIKRGYKEKKTELDFQLHWGALLAYIIILIGSFFVINYVFFKDLDRIHNPVEKFKSEDFRDNRRPHESKKYSTIKVNGIQWMTENLNYGLDSTCIASKLPMAGGRFYSWDLASSDSLCPKGWRLPTMAEWQKLKDVFGDSSAAAQNLKSGSDQWGVLKGDNSVDFSALPAGFYNTHNGGNIKDAGKSAKWWTFTMESENKAFVVTIDSSGMKIDAESITGIDYFSVRCVKIDGDKVPLISKPKSVDSSKVVTKKKGRIVDFKDGTDLPYVDFGGKQPSLLYDSTLFSSIKSSNDPITNDKVERQRNDRRLLFPKDSRIEVRSYYEKVFSKKDSVWKKDTLWVEDSVKVSGQYTVVDLDWENDFCKVGFSVFVGSDSTTANVLWRQPCDLLKKGDEYLSDIYYHIYRRCNDKECSLKHNFVKADIYAKQ